MDLIRVLFVSDTHLGLDLPAKPRVTKARRGADFFENLERALEPARRREVDLVLHGGDVFFRSRVRPELVDRAFRLFRSVAERGVPVYVVPGNHERSRIPYGLLAQHDDVFLFDRPRTYIYQRERFRLAVAGFPYARDVRRRFRDLLALTGIDRVRADARVLLMHQCVEGARVGPKNFTFRDGDDVIASSQIPADLAAVLSGHVHRAQAFATSSGVPILYPGSIERTSFAERKEKKGYLIVAIDAEGPTRGRLRGFRFQELPARPMISLEVSTWDLERTDFPAWMSRKLAALPERSIVRLRFRNGAARLPGSVRLRSLAPPGMIVSVSIRSESGGSDISSIGLVARP